MDEEETKPHHKSHRKFLRISREETASGFESPEYEKIRYFIVGARPIMLVYHEDRVWTESIDWTTGEFKLDMSYFARVIDGTNVEVDEVDLEVFREHVDSVRSRNV